MAVYLIVYGFTVNALAVLLFGWDKHQARTGGWRVPEARLLALAVFGGWPALKLGQRLYRHKTRKQPFGALLNASIPLSFVVLGAVWLAINPDFRNRLLGEFQVSHPEPDRETPRLFLRVTD